MPKNAPDPKFEPKSTRRDGLPSFDPYLPPDNPQNIAAARARRLHFVPAVRAYVDEDGCLILDQFGQKL